MFDSNLRFHPSPVNETPAFLKTLLWGPFLKTYAFGAQTRPLRVDKGWNGENSHGMKSSDHDSGKVAGILANWPTLSCNILSMWITALLFTAQRSSRAKTTNRNEETVKRDDHDTTEW